jgi:hypothetical protein
MNHIALKLLSEVDQEMIKHKYFLWCFYSHPAIVSTVTFHFFFCTHSAFLFIPVTSLCITDFITFGVHEQNYINQMSLIKYQTVSIRHPNKYLILALTFVFCPFDINSIPKTLRSSISFYSILLPLCFSPPPPLSVKSLKLKDSHSRTLHICRDISFHEVHVWCMIWSFPSN